ncbi:MAG TPA: YdcF family protein, partial [Actinomycetota bacterium]
MGLLRRHPLITLLLLGLLAALTVLSVTVTAVWQAAHRDEARYIDRTDVVLVLGAAQYNGRPSPVFESRLRHAALLYHERFAPEVVVLGANEPGDLTTEAAAGRAWLIGDGLPPTSVVAEPRGNTTFESLQAAAQFMRRAHLHSAFLVSDPWHNLRIRRMA